MEKIINLIEKEVLEGFIKAGYDEQYGKVIESDRPDLCEYQCNGAMALAKIHKKAPYIIAEEIVKNITKNNIENIEVVKPGFINIKIKEEKLAQYCNKMAKDIKLGIDENKGKKVILDYGGPNVAKPLHVGHLRPAIIGESIKRIHRYFGDEVIGDVHLGDWGLQMGLIIEELKQRNPELVYFDESYTGEYPKEAPFTINELEEIYPVASKKTKPEADATEEEKQRAQDYLENARKNTGLLQSKKRGYYDLWKKMVEVSVKDIKKNYKRLNVEFDLWLGESDSQEYVPQMIEQMKKLNIIYESDGAMVVDVQEPTDNITINPCMILKRGGVSCYQTTDLATLLQREKDFNPDKVIYVVDKRQEMHFVQVFRCAKKAKIVKDSTELTYLGFGTINGKDGKPFKTRTGGVMRLEMLIDEVNDKVLQKLKESRDMELDEAKEIAEIIGLAALKYADLQNQISKDYIFDVDKFTSFEGNTGPYILYTIVRIKSIIKKYLEKNPIVEDFEIANPKNEKEKKLMLLIAKFNKVAEQAYVENAPYRLCNYIYELSNEFNTFYHETKILTEEGETVKSYIALISLIKKILETSIDLLGFSAPDKM